MSDLYQSVKGLSRSNIRNATKKIRQITGVFDQKNFCAVQWLENKFLPSLGFDLEVCERESMGQNHGLTDHATKTVFIREDVYENAYNGAGRDRMTLVHEGAHCFLHTPDRVHQARSFTRPPTYQDPEWQAKAFAGELLVPVYLIDIDMTASDIAREFGVSFDAAKFQMRVYERDGLMNLNGSALEADPKVTWKR